jgi:hypothetical protein
MTATESTYRAPTLDHAELPSLTPAFGDLAEELGIGSLGSIGDEAWLSALRAGIALASAFELPGASYRRTRVGSAVQPVADPPLPWGEAAKCPSSGRQRRAAHVLRTRGRMQRCDDHLAARSTVRIADGQNAQRVPTRKALRGRSGRPQPTAPS